MSSSATGINQRSQPMTTHPPESRTCTDPRTGVRVRQVTDHPSIHHHPFYYLPCMDDAMIRLFFVSHRTGRPENHHQQHQERKHP
jgi:hypothetical protein